MAGEIRVIDPDMNPDLTPFVHTLGHLLVVGLVAVIVYEKLRVRILQRVCELQFRGARSYLAIAQCCAIPYQCPKHVR